MNFSRVLVYSLIFIVSCTNSNVNLDNQSQRLKDTEGWKEYNPMPDVSLRLPINWHVYEGEPGAYVENCDEEFCTNLVCYTLDDVGKRTIEDVKKLFLKAMKNRSSKFEMISTKKGDNIMTIAYYYTHVDYALELTGSVRIWIKNNKIYVFQISGLRRDYKKINAKTERIFSTITIS